MGVLFTVPIRDKQHRKLNMYTLLRRYGATALCTSDYLVLGVLI
jgi:hypothetical protein